MAFRALRGTVWRSGAYVGFSIFLKVADVSVEVVLFVFFEVTWG